MFATIQVVAGKQPTGWGNWRSKSWASRRPDVKTDLQSLELYLYSCGLLGGGMDRDRRPAQFGDEAFLEFCVRIR
jgi:hypothetical protein